MDPKLTYDAFWKSALSRDWSKVLVHVDSLISWLQGGGDYSELSLLSLELKDVPPRILLKISTYNALLKQASGLEEEEVYDDADWDDEGGKEY